MKTLILILALTLLGSCSTERDQEEGFKYLIQVDFMTGVVKEGGKILIKADEKTEEICNQIIKGKPLSEGYFYKTLCIGSDGNGTSFMYILLTSPTTTAIILITYNNTATLSNLTPDFLQESCLKRSIISN